MSEVARPCCQAIRGPTLSPFEIIQLGYYDGVTEGLARCRVCATTYAFDTTCGSDVRRVYGLARISEAHYLAVAAALERPPSLDGMQEWLRDVALLDASVPSHKGERDLFVIADNLEVEIILARKVLLAELVEFLKDPGP